MSADDVVRRIFHYIVNVILFRDGFNWTPCSKIYSTVLTKRRTYNGISNDSDK